jgi:hypothetical protein
VWGEWGREGVEPRAAQGAVMSGSVKRLFYRSAWRAEASGGGQWSLTLSVLKSKRGRGVNGVLS